MRWRSGPSDGRRRALVVVFYGKRGGKTAHKDAWTLSPAGTPVARGVRRCVSSLNRCRHTGQNCTVFPFVVNYFRSEVDRSPGGQGAHFTGNEVLREPRCHSEAGWPNSVSSSSLTLTGLRAERCGWVELESEPRGLTGLWLEQQGRPSREEEVSAPAS